jgi:hypothetical protein
MFRLFAFITLALAAAMGIVGFTIKGWGVLDAVALGLCLWCFSTLYEFRGDYYERRGSGVG